MLNLIFSIIAVILSLFLLWCLVVAIFSITGGIIAFILRTPIFWGALLGGLIAYLLGYHSNQELINGMICGGGLAFLIWVCSFFGAYKILTVLGCLAVGIFFGWIFNAIIIMGIIGLCVGIYKVC